MRKFHPFAAQAKAQGKNIYHLNIGQPDIETPAVYFKAIEEFPNPVIEYVESPGIPPWFMPCRIITRTLAWSWRNRIF